MPDFGRAFLLEKNLKNMLKTVKIAVTEFLLSVKYMGIGVNGHVLHLKQQKNAGDDYLKRVVLDLQSGLYAKAVRRILAQDLDELQVDIAKTPDETAERCKLLQADVLIMEVTPFTPWQLLERMSIQAKVKKELPLCKYILLVDEKIEKKLLDDVKWSKQQGFIDAFLFTSVPESYLVAVVDSM